MRQTEKTWKGRKEKGSLVVAGIVARIWAAVGAQDPPTHVSQLCHWKSGIKLSSTVISVLESCITLFRRQACRELSPPIPCPAASQQTSWNLWNLYIFITFPQTHTYMLNVPENSFAYLNRFLELIYIRAGVFWGSLVAIWGTSHSSNYPFLVISPPKQFIFFEWIPVMWAGQDTPLYQRCSGPHSLRWSLAHLNTRLRTRLKLKEFTRLKFYLLLLRIFAAGRWIWEWPMGLAIKQ